MKFSDFDKHIQENAARNLEAPSEFDWENMDIAIPERKSRKPMLLLLLTTAILASGSLYFFNIQKVNKHIEESEELIETQPVATNSNQVTTKALENTFNSTDREIVQPDFYTPKENTKTRSKASIEQKDLTSKITDNRLSVAKNTTPQYEQKLQKAIQQKPIIQNEIKNIETALVQNQLQLSKLLTTLAYKKLRLDKEGLPVIPTFSEQKSIRPRDGGWTFVIRNNYTNNHFQSSNVEYLDILEASDIGAWSQSLSVRKAFALTSDWFGSVGLSYHHLHTVFSHNQYLGYEDIINAAGRPDRIHKTRVVYHNNYSNIAEINLGLGKTYPLTNRLYAQFQIGVNGGYQFSDKGKTLDTSLGIADKDFTSRLILSTSADAHIVYRMEKFKLLVGGGYAKSLTSLHTIDASTLTNRPNMFFMDIGVGYQF